MTYPRPPHRGEAVRFFTVSLAEPGAHMLVDRIDQLRAAFVSLLRAHPVRVDAMVVLPDHLHAVWVLPATDTDFAGRWRILKGRFTRLSASATGAARSPWQPRFTEHPVSSVQEHRARIEYCWQDPVRHGLCRHAADWPFSSFQRDTRRGLVTRDWRGPAMHLKAKNGIRPSGQRGIDALPPQGRFDDRQETRPR